jgi:hypothetical protein
VKLIVIVPTETVVPDAPPRAKIEALVKAAAALGLEIGVELVRDTPEPEPHEAKDPPESP